MDALPGAELDEGSSHVLPTLVVTRSLHPQPQAIFGIGLKRLESRESVTLLPQEGNHPEPRRIADKCHPVDVAFRSRNGQRALEVRVDEGKPYEFSGCKTRDRMAVELTSKARLTDGRRWMLRTDGEAGNEVVGVCRAEVIEIDM